MTFWNIKGLNTRCILDYIYWIFSFFKLRFHFILGGIEFWLMRIFVFLILLEAPYNGSSITCAWRSCWRWISAPVGRRYETGPGSGTCRCSSGSGGRCTVGCIIPKWRWGKQMIWGLVCGPVACSLSRALSGNYRSWLYVSTEVSLDHPGPSRNSQFKWLSSPLNRG